MTRAEEDDGVDAAHDPGFDVARQRAEAVSGARPHAVIVNAGEGRTIRVGTAGWTDPTLTAPGVFYPSDATTPEARLRYYASRFPTVEIDAPYYALPTPRNGELWAARTPDDFVFDVKAFALMTGHPTEVARFPKTIRDALPKDLAARTRVYAKDLPGEIVDEVWSTFRLALQPLVDAGKMGAVLLQYPRWHMPNALGRDEILDARARLPDVQLAVEFRNRRWLAPTVADRVFRFLADHDMAYVVVDEPQGLASSVPPVTAVTSSELAIVRMHGRRGDQWERRGASVADKYRYLYDAEQLAEWAPRIAEVAAQAKQTRVVFNNCYGNYGTTNALEMTAMLAE
ncbi:protein of unknown function DUF72 (plasmid) [Gemmatirosa kalamazoonensis]|uniref:DUF72 domain-containing protein n=1 Tax=Gemmatirosa kalamazoonensis TaxID=861299 RepID=W0RP31_9BACT|nr:DUF72 domain-containing protein [Gemmatirosa kalamazoonensis]AHG92501.1 protein of unknown function DUF72 [Gemmatirosa kalamazoonensis]